MQRDDITSPVHIDPTETPAHGQVSAPYRSIFAGLSAVLIAFNGLLPMTMGAKSLNTLPLIFLALGFLFGALVAQGRDEPSRFWLFIVASLLTAIAF